MSRYTDEELGSKTSCRKCGAECFKQRSKKGFDYLGEARSIGYEDGTWSSKKIGHRCDPLKIEIHQAFLVESAAQNVLDVAAGEIVKGQQVVVVKGRSVKKGTAGLVFWVAPEPNSYGITKVGFKTVEGEAYFTDEKNLKVAVAQ